MITKHGKRKLEEQLQKLKEELRLTYEKRSEAAAEGDLKENSAYIFQGERANVLNSQIAEIISDLSSSEVKSAPLQTKSIEFGHQVTVRFENDQREMTIVLVGKNDARLQPNWVSCESPLGLALIGKSQGDQVLINDQPVTILKIDIGNI